MEPAEGQTHPSQKLTPRGWLEVLLRVIAFFLGLVSLIGALWSARDGSYPNITALSQAALMFICALSLLRPSRPMLAVLLIAAVFAGIDFVVRALPALRAESYPLDIVLVYAVELTIALWFICKHDGLGQRAP
jgi:hypothetical protein